MKKILVVVICLAMITTTLIGCSGNGEAPTGGSDVTESNEVSRLTWRLATDPPTLDPQINSHSVGRQINKRIFEGLIREEYNLEMSPGVAEKWEISDDHKSITFYLKEDAKWSDGVEVTSKDFEYAWKRGLDPEVAVARVSDFFYIKDAEAYFLGEVDFSEIGIKFPDDYTIVLELTHEMPEDELLFRLSSPVFWPLREDIISANPDNWTTSPDKIVSNGPFKMADYKMNEELILIKDENYWDKENKALIDEIRFVFIEDALTALRAFEAGEIDGFEGIPSEEISRLTMESDEFHIHPAIGFTHVVFNVERAPVDNKLVREALVLAIDKEQIADAVVGGTIIPATGVVPFGAVSDGKDFRTESDKNGPILPVNGDVERAKAALAEAGYPNGEGFPKLEYLYNTSGENNTRIAEMLQEMWRSNLNIDIDLVNTEFAVESERRHSGEFQIARRSWSGNHLPFTFLSAYGTGDYSNQTNYSNPEYDALLAEIRAETDLTKRDELMHKAEEMAMEDFVVCPIGYPTFTYVLNEKFKGAQVPTTDTIIFEYIYLDE